MKSMQTKEEVLETVSAALKEISSNLIISSTQDQHTHDMLNRSYTAIEVALLAVRGAYHTEN